jgi:hypothetical protein
MVGQQFYDSANADLFVVVESLEPASEFVGALNFPGHHLNMPLDTLCVKSYNAPQLISTIRRKAFPVKQKIPVRPQHKREELTDVAEFIRLVHSRLTAGVSLQDDGIWFSRRDDGSLFLDPEEARNYSHVVTELMKRYVPSDDLSRRSVESFLQRALFSSLDLRSRSTKSFQEKLAAALDELLAVLKTPSEDYVCWVPVDGLRLDHAGATFGGIRFVQFGRHQLRQLTGRRPTSQSRLVSWTQTLKTLRDERLWGAVCACVKVQARDSQSAEVLAIRRARQTIAVVNLFTDLVPYNYGWVYLRGEATRSQQIVPIQNVKGDFAASHTTLEPFADVSWKALSQAKGIARPFRTLNRLARSGNRFDSGARVLVSAAQWIGEATVERRREQSFLLYAVALETMMLPTHEGGELGYRLRLRTAHVLGKTLPARERIAREVGRLYGIRSRIVHAGSYEVTDSDLGSLRAIVKGALFRLLHFHELQLLSRQELAVWLDRKILR